MIGHMEPPGVAGQAIHPSPCQLSSTTRADRVDAFEKQHVKEPTLVERFDTTNTTPTMPSALVPDPKPTERHDDLDNYDVDDFFDDPFASPPPDASSKKRKEPESGLGIDEEVSVQKRARVPNVKLDEER
jgi:hypothetical protein